MPTHTADEPHLIQGSERSSVRRIMDHYGCDSEEAQLYVDLRDEGYSVYQAGVLAGIRDPDY